ncbi:MAG TPA: hypothetical protein VFI11_01720 [Anaerolineales bacterium]|nr:hypothetical protein [Anaerolineales bacterium]
MDNLRRITRPRCFLVYALAPASVSPAEANRAFNNFTADPGLPLVIFHDHFIGRPGGMAIFFVDTPTARDALLDHKHLEGWQVEIHPLIFSDSPSAFDEQIAFTLARYRGLDWETLRSEDRPSYGDHGHEAETAHEE